MTNNEEKIFEKHCGKKVCSKKLNIEGFDKPIPFEIYDGYAYCANYKGKRLDMQYPQLRAVKDSKELTNAIIDYIDDVTCKEEITPIHILITFNTLFKDGVEIKAE